jgi:hypothetical protein
MYQFEYLAKERQNDLRREADRERLIARARQIAGRRSGMAASTLRWTGKQLSTWGDQLQKEYASDEIVR